MPNYKRYEVVGKWSVSTEHAPNGDVVITTETAQLKDKQTGDVFTDGAWRVRFTNYGKGGDAKIGKTKVWFGETAWMSAERYARDAYFALQAGREVPAR